MVSLFFFFSRHILQKMCTNVLVGGIHYLIKVSPQCFVNIKLSSYWLFSYTYIVKIKSCFWQMTFIELVVFFNVKCVAVKAGLLPYVQRYKSKSICQHMKNKRVPWKDESFSFLKATSTVFFKRKQNTRDLGIFISQNLRFNFYNLLILVFFYIIFVIFSLELIFFNF